MDCYRIGSRQHDWFWCFFITGNPRLLRCRKFARLGSDTLRRTIAGTRLFLAGEKYHPHWWLIRVCA